MEGKLEKQLHNILHEKIHDADRHGSRVCANCIHAKVFGVNPSTGIPNATCEEGDWPKIYSLLDFARNGPRIYRCPDWENSK